jgi:DNA invertase Pin-like site-specific DNA recombinase
MPRVIGYARCSSVGQSVDDQVERLKAAGADPVYFEKISGGTMDRPQLKRALRSLEPGDVFLFVAVDTEPCAISNDQLENVTRMEVLHGGRRLPTHQCQM